MSSIQTFRYKRKKLTVIFWDSKIWFELKEICFLLKTRKDDGIYKLSFDIPEYMADEDKRLKNKPKLISASGLEYLIRRVTMSPQRREKLEDLYDWICAEVMPAFDSYLRSWL